MNERPIPQSLDSEQSALGAMMTTRRAIVRAMAIVTANDFRPERHRQMFTAISHLYDTGESVDIMTVAPELKRRGWLESVGGFAYVQACYQACASDESIETYCKVILEKSIRRQLIKASEQTVKDAYDEGNDIAELLACSEKRFLEIGKSRTRDTFVGMAELVDGVCLDIKTASETPNGAVGKATGFHALDDLTGGMQGGDFIVVGARPSMGKTGLCVQIAEYVATTEQLPVAVHSLEMKDKSLVRRLLSSHSNINGQTLRRGRLQADQWQQLADGSLKLRQCPLWIRDTPRASMYDIKAHSRRLASEQGKLGLIVVDHMALIMAENKSAPRYLQVAEIAHELKALAKEMDCPLILLSQLSRKVEEREDKRPVISDMRESGDIEQDADLVWLLYRDAYYQRKQIGSTFRPQDDEVAEVIIGKQREGPTATVELIWRDEFTRFENKY